MAENILKFKIVNLLKNHVLKDISINDFKRLTDVLDLDSMTLKVRDAIIEEKRSELSTIEFNSEWDLLESLEDG